MLNPTNPSLSSVFPRTSARSRNRQSAQRRGGPAKGESHVVEALEERRLFALAITPVSGTTLATQLANQLLVPNTGLTVTGGTFVSQTGQAGTYTGFDLVSTGGAQRLTIQDGLLLTSGTAVAALGPNNSPSESTAVGTAGDPDLTTLAGGPTFDANSLTIQFTADASTKSILFDFIFGSEEYPEFVGSFFNDTFGAYLDGVQVSFDINRRPITVNNNFFQINNTGGVLDAEYDGFTPRIRTQAPLSAAATHTLKFVIADTEDEIYDSGVFVARLQGSAVVVPGPTTDLPNPGVLKLSSDSYSVAENGGTATILVQRVNGTSGEVSVDYAILAGTATDGADYTGSTGTLVFADGQISQTITVPILDDALVEGDETAIVTLSNPVDAGLGTPNVATLNILDDERAVQFNPNTYSVREDQGSVTLTVARTGPAIGPVTVDFATADGTAINGQDYDAQSGTLTFGDGQTSATITVPIVGDFIDDEAAETFTVALSNISGADFGPQTIATVTIQNIDRPPSIYDISAYAPRGHIEALFLTFNDPMNADRAMDLANYHLYLRNETRFGGPPSRNELPLRAAEYVPASRIVTLRPMVPLRQNSFYEVRVRTTTPAGLVSQANQMLDGDFDRIPGEDFIGYFGRGTRLVYSDRNGDRVRLGASRGGVLEVFRGVDREARIVRLMGAVPNSSIVFGRVTPRERQTDYVTNIGLLLLNGAQNLLSDPPFKIERKIS